MIIHTAAINPGQGDDDAMWRVNVTGSRNVAEAAVTRGPASLPCPRTYSMTVPAGPYADNAPPTPINAYGRSKAEGEAAVLEVDPSAVAVRTSLMYGLDEMDRGTAGFADRLARGEVVRLFSDVLRNPIWVETLADALVRLAATDAVGTLNIAGAEAVTREDYGRRMLAFWGIDSNRIESIRATDISDSTPLDVRLDSSKASSLLGIPFPGLTAVLER